MNHFTILRFWCLTLMQKNVPKDVALWKHPKTWAKSKY
jgi:hypothetical protein